MVHSILDYVFWNYCFGYIGFIKIMKTVLSMICLSIVAGLVAGVIAYVISWIALAFYNGL